MHRPPPIESPKRDHSRRHYVLIVLSGFMRNFTACGIVFAYGVYQAKYEKMATRHGTPFTGASSAEITLIGSLSSAIMKLGAPFVVAWCKCFSPRILRHRGLALPTLAGAASRHRQLSLIIHAFDDRTTNMVLRMPRPRPGFHFGRHRHRGSDVRPRDSGLYLRPRLPGYTPVYYISSYGQTLGYTTCAMRLGRSPDLPAAKACFIVFTVLYGLFASAYIGLSSPALVELFGLEDMPRITGIMYMMQGAAGLVGTPVAGLLVRTSNGKTTSRSYLDMAIFVGALMVASTLAVAWVHVEQGFGRVRGHYSWVWKL
ncbi:hypothetical protein BO82DRAFT_417863 [Aspergillus uvarum CBS 121591]|uniref:MFS general substrate transporter n=1 Tax=Aspergillus uvarum CBS 121591 TaxID=1448315 RepID=A0A319CX94_9EURO|nr:hypothetical protein BO82DRAFT_417863 [Aspergillus uvarum CBS 121591]PYH80238.1 hypothetical protein BO82DRAFT_417863 [Aspergillus uvarum CBS 121591]